MVQLPLVTDLPHGKHSFRGGSDESASTHTGTRGTLRAAVREVGGLFVLDCIASGTVWVDMPASEVDVLISAPQQGWSGPACCALIGLSRRARNLIDDTTSTSFACDLKKWPLGVEVRALLEIRGFRSVAAEQFMAPSVIVSYTVDPDIQSGQKCSMNGLQCAAGVPLQCGEPADFRSFSIGLFGLDKLQNPVRTVNVLKSALSVVHPR